MMITNLHMLNISTPPDPVDGADRVPNCICLRFATDGEVVHYVDFNLSTSGIIESKEWYGLVLFSSIMSVHPIVI